MLVRDEIARLLAEAAAAAQQSGALPDVALPGFTVEPPQRPDHGDYATNLALRLARAARTAPLQIAHVLEQALPSSPMIARSDVAAPGFINFTLSNDWLAEQLETVLAEGADFGRSDLGHGRRVQVEFVSANPTGPLHAGSGRGAALGDALANLLAFTGHNVQREYYVNDAGRRMEAFNRSVYVRYIQRLGQAAQLPQDGYHGAYLVDLAGDLVAQYGDRFTAMPEDQAAIELGRIGMERMVALHRADMDALGVAFDCWLREQSLYDSGEVDATIAVLRERGYVTEREGAVWFTSSSLGDERDNVLVRSTGVPGYMASDIAYHRNKLCLRGFDQVIDIWGADHMGHVPRMRAAVRALGIDPERFVIIVHQNITLRRGGTQVRLSKRTGDIILLADLIDEVGRDACRFFFASRSPDSQMDFDLELAKRESNENPVYYCQYAHARIASILRKAGERVGPFRDGDTSLLTHPSEQQLIRRLMRFPELIIDAARQLQPHPLTYFAQEVAGDFHALYNQCRVLPGTSPRSDDPSPAVAKARLKLVAATKQVLANAIGLLGVTAPERMARADEE